MHILALFMAALPLVVNLWSSFGLSLRVDWTWIYHTETSLLSCEFRFLDFLSLKAITLQNEDFRSLVWISGKMLIIINLYQDWCTLNNEETKNTT